MIRVPNPYWGTAGAGIIPVAKSTGRFLVAMRSQDVMEPRTYGTIGGKLDEDWETGDLEDPMDAALREFEEETCEGESALVDIIPLYVFDDTNADFQYYNFLGVLDDEFEACINWETDWWEWLTLDELLAIEPKHFGLRALLRDRESLRTMKEFAR